MVRGMNWKKGTALVMASALIMGLMPQSQALSDLMGKIRSVKAENVADGENANVEEPFILKVEADFFDYNIKNCEKTNGKHSANGEEKVLLTRYTRNQAKKGNVDSKQLFLFGGQREKEKDGAQNTWTGARKGQYEGIVEPKMVDGNIQFTYENDNENGIYGVNIFPSEEEYEAAWRDTNDLTLQDVVKPYYGKEFQFINEDGYYRFDSREHGITGVSEDKVSVDFSAPGPVFGSGTGTDQNITGFFPFNTKDEKNNAIEERHHMFGMKLTIPFDLTKDGKIEQKDGTKKDMVFRFSGDDDVWIFIDGNLAIDLGGIHDRVAAGINFASGDITYEQDSSGGKSYGIENIYSDNVVVSPGAITGAAVKENTKHVMTMFYLERGEFDSNCSINFNIPAEGEKVIPTPTPVITSTPEVTTVPAITGTPVVTTMPAVTATPEVTTTPAVTSTPVVTATIPVTETSTPVPTKTPAVKTSTPIFTNPPATKTYPPVVVTKKPEDTPKPTEVPTTKPVVTVKPTEAPTTKPVVTVKPTEVPTTKPVITAKPTEVPTTKPVVTVKPTSTPTEINAPKPTEEVIIEETQVPGGYVTPAPTVKETSLPESRPDGDEETYETENPYMTEQPLGTDKPYTTDQPYAEPTGQPVEVDEDGTPSGGVKVSPKPAGTRDDEDSEELVDEDDEPGDNPKKDSEVVVEDNIPSILPKTGAIGEVVKKNFVLFGFMIVDIIAGSAVVVYLLIRKKKK